MISFNRYKDLLDDLADTLSDEEILELSRKQKLIVELAFKVWEKQQEEDEV